MTEKIYGNGDLPETATAIGNGEVFEIFKEEFEAQQDEEMSLPEYLFACRDDKQMYASIAERMTLAIGKPDIFDTSTDPRLGRIFGNRTIKRYSAFSDFYGTEEVIERIVNFFTYAAQGLEERKQILYLLGPVGGGKSSLAERLKELLETQPMYVLKAGDKMSPVFESPLGIFHPKRYGDTLEDKYNIPRRRLTGMLSPWAVKRLDEFHGDISQFKVVKVMPSKLRQTGIAKTEPGDENNQDISSLVGKVDIRMLEHFSQKDPDAYSHSGGLNYTTQGLLEFVEMFKAPVKVLHPLLTATQDGNYAGTEGIGSFPYQGIILAHSNEAEWAKFKSKKENEAFLDRICVVQVPYCLRVSEEVKIYQKLIRESNLFERPLARETLDILSRFCVLTRLCEHDEKSSLYSKMRVYDGEDIKNTDPNAKSMAEYKDVAGVTEGMTGVSTRFAFKVLSATFNYDPTEVAADPVHLLYVLEQAIKHEQYPKETEERFLGFLKKDLTPRYAEDIAEDIQRAYVESYDEYGQNVFDRYIAHADAWIEEQDYKDPDTGVPINRDELHRGLEKIEKPASVTNAKDFRNEVVKYCLRERANTGTNPRWTSYEKMREVIEKHMFSKIEDLLPVISFGSKKDHETGEKHDQFVGRMKERGYTERQVRRLVEWYMRVNKAS